MLGVEGAELIFAVGESTGWGNFLGGGMSKYSAGGGGTFPHHPSREKAAKWRQINKMMPTNANKLLPKRYLFEI